jgi:hypothetical protein
MVDIQYTYMLHSLPREKATLRQRVRAPKPVSSIYVRKVNRVTDILFLSNNKITMFAFALF